MTVAVDKKTGAVVGQVVNTQPGIKGPGGTCVPCYTILTAEGYRAVSVWSVRLEEA